MNRRQWLATTGVAAAAAAGGAAWSWWRGQAGPAGALPAAEQALWKQRFDQPEGGEVVMAPLQGQPLLLNFWATWCAPCVKELPLIDAFYRRHRPQGWQVLGLAVDAAAPVREFLAKVPVGFPVGLAGLNGVDLSRSLGNPQGGLPFSVIFNARGQAIFRRLGTVSEEDLERWAAQLARQQ